MLLKWGPKCLLAAFLLFVQKIPAFAISRDNKAVYGEIQIDREPQKSDWQYFMHADPSFRKQLWSYYERQGKKLSDWSWGWRVGWVNTCIRSQEKWCWTIYKEALFDQALVVRSEAAVRIGERFKGTKNNAMINLLSAAYKNPQNLRSGKPLFVQKRILFAIREIGGPTGINEGLKLSRNHQDTAKYWTKLGL